jgi:hypothetical protein
MHSMLVVLVAAAAVQARLIVVLHWANLSFCFLRKYLQDLSQNMPRELRTG